MDTRINKPRAFLSHSKLDTDFIERLANDLRRCQIEPWLDTEEIRDGKQWLKIIFEEGIPTCDVVIVYFTENSLKSKMVAKELDATIIEQLSESGISLLPYVNQVAIRSKLRGDIRSLQCREWNIHNYNDILPTVVAEIWRSYLERIVKTATLVEQNIRMKLELEMKKLKDRFEGSPFTPSEEKEFQYIRKMLDKSTEVILGFSDEDIETGRKGFVGKDIFNISIFFIINLALELGYIGLEGSLLKHLKNLLKDQGTAITSGSVKRWYEELEVDARMVAELRTYGLLNTIPMELKAPYQLYTDHRDVFTEKLYRFRYWLNYNSYTMANSVEYIGVTRAKKSAQEQD